jgi:hypothetical protein
MDQQLADLKILAVPYFAGFTYRMVQAHTVSRMPSAWTIRNTACATRTNSTTSGNPTGTRALFRSAYPHEIMLNQENPLLKRGRERGE